MSAKSRHAERFSPGAYSAARSPSSSPWTKTTDEAMAHPSQIKIMGTHTSGTAQRGGIPFSRPRVMRLIAGIFALFAKEREGSRMAFHSAKRSCRPFTLQHLMAWTLTVPASMRYASRRMQLLLDAIRKASLPGIWSQGGEARSRRLGVVDLEDAGRAHVSRARARSRDRAHGDPLHRGAGVDVRLRREDRPMRARRGGDPGVFAGRRTGRAARGFARREGAAARVPSGREGRAPRGHSRPHSRRRTPRAAGAFDRVERGARARALGMGADARRPARRPLARNARSRGRSARPDSRCLRSAVDRQ